MGNEPFLSSSWYRVGGLRPRLPGHAEVMHHRYRGRRWYILQDKISRNVHRISPASYLVVSAMDGIRTVDEIWTGVAQELGENAPTQDEMIRLLSQLYSAGLLHIDATPDVAGLFERTREVERSRIIRTLLNPMAVRLPIWNPDQFLQATLMWFKWIFTPAGFALWLVVVTPAIILAMQNWQQLNENVADRVLAAESLLVIGLCYPILKALHELGHGYAVRAFGGAVPELGVMLLVFLPIPYVDASSSSGFRSKWARAVVGAAGMLVETFFAALALYVWLLVEPGLVRTIAFNVMLIAGLSTIVFNANPLLRYDGYYILADVLQIPNLYQRATQYWGYLVRKYLFGVDETKADVVTHGERVWLFLYAPLSLFYRQFVAISIALFIASQYLTVGVVLAIWSLMAGLFFPAGKAIWRVVSSPQLQRNRVRAVSVTFGGIAAVACLTLFVPLPLHTTTEGVVWLPENSFVKAGTDGFVKRIIVEPGKHVTKGEALVESEEPTSAANLARLRARAEELEAQLESVRFSDRVQATIATTALTHARAELDHESRRVSRLVVQSQADGTFVIDKPQDLPGRFVREGQTFGYVLPAGTQLIRAAIPQDDIDLVRTRLRSASVKLIERPETTLAVNMVREVPGGRDELPSKALGGGGGGSQLTDPRDPRGTKTLQRVFQFDFVLAENSISPSWYGSRVYIRFEHYWEPLGHQLWRRTRQLLLTRLQA
jgi:putative peptide zinc metalloprotease protein